MRMAKMIILKRNTVIFYQILLTCSLLKFIEISLENLLVDIRASMVKRGWPLKRGLIISKLFFHVQSKVLHVTKQY